MISVKDFAIKCKASESIIYRHIRKHREELGENVYKAHGRTWLTPEGESFISNLMTQQTVIFEKASDELLSLRRQLDEKNTTIEMLKETGRVLQMKYDEQLLAISEHAESIANLETKNDELEKQLKKSEDEKHLEEQARIKAEERADAAEQKLETLTLGGFLKMKFGKKGNK